MGNGVRAQGEGHDAVRVKVQRRRWGGVRGEEWREEWNAGMRARVRAWDKAARVGGEEAKMACEITSDAILPI